MQVQHHGGQDDTSSLSFRFKMSLSCGPKNLGCSSISLVISMVKNIALAGQLPPQAGTGCLGSPLAARSRCQCDMPLARRLCGVPISRQRWWRWNQQDKLAVLQRSGEGPQLCAAVV